MGWCENGEFNQRYGNNFLCAKKYGKTLDLGVPNIFRQHYILDLIGHSYGHLPVISTYNPIYRMYNPIYNQL